MDEPAGLLALWDAGFAHYAGQLGAVGSAVADDPVDFHAFRSWEFELAVFGLNLNVSGSGCTFWKLLQAGADSWCCGFIASEYKVVIFCRWTPRAAWAEEAELLPDLSHTCPGTCKTGVTVGDKVDVEVTGL